MEKILVVVAHPDDEVLGCGGTILKHIEEGDEVYLCIATRAYPPEYDEKICQEKKKEAIEVSKKLGVKKTFFLDIKTTSYYHKDSNQPSLSELPHHYLNHRLSEVFNEVKPTIVYTHHLGDPHIDHKTLFDSVMVLTRPKPGSSVKKVMVFEVLSETNWSPPFGSFIFTPNVYIDISKHLDKKIEIMKTYKSEINLFPHPRSLEALRANAIQRGSTIGKEAAEAFMLVREIIH